MRDFEKMLFALIRSEINNEKPDSSIIDIISASSLNEVFELANKHSIVPIIADVLSKYNLFPDEHTSQLYKKTLFESVILQEKQSYELKRISDTFEKCEIAYIPLKGSFLRNYYSKPWLRTCSDIDVLVHPEDLENAKNELINLGYKFHFKGSHDISFFSPSGIHVELHYAIIEENRASNSNEILNEIWDYAEVEKGKYGYQLLDEMFYFYHIAHMAKHFENGGCGIRSLIDLWILNHKFVFNKDKRTALLKEGNLHLFAKEIENLCEIWFSGKDENEFSTLLQNYILTGGVFGNIENNVAIQQQKHGGKFNFILKRIFMPYDKIKNLYPILKKHKYLLPLFEVYRWFDLIIKGNLKKSFYEIKTNNTALGENNINLKEIWDKLGI